MSGTVRTPSLDGYLTTKEVALRYPVTEAQLNGWRAKGEGPAFVKVGSRIRYPVASTAAWFAALGQGAEPSEALAGGPALSVDKIVRDLLDEYVGEDGFLVLRRWQSTDAVVAEVEAEPRDGTVWLSVANRDGGSDSFVYQPAQCALWRSVEPLKVEGHWEPLALDGPERLLCVTNQAVADGIHHLRTHLDQEAFTGLQGAEHQVFALQRDLLQLSSTVEGLRLLLKTRYILGGAAR